MFLGYYLEQNKHFNIANAIPDKLPGEQTSQITTKKCQNAITVTPCERAFTQCFKNFVRQFEIRILYHCCVFLKNFSRKTLWESPHNKSHLTGHSL